MRSHWVKHNHGGGLHSELTSTKLKNADFLTGDPRSKTL
jgi:hypothetical protein